MVLDFPQLYKATAVSTRPWAFAMPPIQPSGEPSPPLVENALALTVIVLAFNEEESLPGLIDEILKTFGDLGQAFDIVIVDDGSTDATPAVAADLSRRLPERIRVATHPANMGMGVAIKTGLADARGERVAILPGDGQFDPADSRRLYEARGDADFSAGDVAASNRRRSDNLIRVFLSWSMRTVLRTLHPAIPRFNGVMVFRRDAVDVDSLVCKTGLVHLEMLDRGRRNPKHRGIRYLPIVVRPRTGGRTKTANIKTILTMIGDMLRLRLAYWLGR